MSSSVSDEPRTLVVALAGNPNSGKTSIFNGLTGLRRKIGNYPGVTVERVQGTLTLPNGSPAKLIDLPGCYSLYAHSEDERIARDVLLGTDQAIGRPDVVIAVVDASNLDRNLYFATQLMETGLPVVIALNMVDVADRAGAPVDAAALETALGVPVVPVVGRTGKNLDALKAALSRAHASERHWQLPEEAQPAFVKVLDAVDRAAIVPKGSRSGEALRLLTHARDEDPYLKRGGDALAQAVQEARRLLEEAGIDRAALEAECRYAFTREIAAKARGARTPTLSRSERIDRVVTHRFLGPVIYLVLLGLIFTSVYSWAVPIMDGIEAATGWVSELVRSALPKGMLADLLVDGAIAGVGNILIFLPQICILFLFLTILEDLGYLARAAFLVDRVMRGVGLHGKSFVPLMSSFACAIPGIMAARNIENRRDRFVTILVAPLMSCAARLPVYTLMIGAFIPSPWQGWTLLGMYVFSVGAALVAAWVFRKTIFRGESSTFILELPRYKMPRVKQVLRTVANRGWVFTKQAGTIILAISIVLWVMAYFPRSKEIAQEANTRIAAGEPEQDVRNWESGAQLRQSIAGRVGLAFEPAIEPLGFDWKLGIGILSSFAAREVLVSTLGIVYSVGDADETSPALREKLRDAKKPDGSPQFTWLTALSLMVFFVLACQCMSTLAVVKRETNSWKWPAFMFGYMTVLAYAASLIVYQGGLALGLV